MISCGQNSIVFGEASSWNREGCGVVGGIEDGIGGEDWGPVLGVGASRSNWGTVVAVIGRNLVISGQIWIVFGSASSWNGIVDVIEGQIFGEDWVPVLGVLAGRIDWVTVVAVIGRYVVIAGRNWIVFEFRSS